MKMSLKKKLKKIINKVAKKKAKKMVGAGAGSGSPSMNSAIGADIVIFTDTSATTLTATARPLRKFRLTKAVLESMANAVATAAGATVVVDQIRCDMEQVFSANASLPITTFRPDSVGNYLKAAWVNTGSEIQIQYRLIGALPVGGQIIVTSGLFGDVEEK
jgi:hypothetical protein